jgi:hypothetical protein
MQIYYISPKSVLHNWTLTNIRFLIQLVRINRFLTSSFEPEKNTFNPIYKVNQPLRMYFYVIFISAAHVRPKAFILLYILTVYARTYTQEFNPFSVKLFSAKQKFVLIIIQLSYRLHKICSTNPRSQALHCRRLM